MATNLTKVYDHPTAVLRASAEKVANGTMEGDVSKIVLRGAAGILEGYERDHGVTFAALDNETLARVREAYAALEDSPARRSEPVLDLMLAVDGLLGLSE